MSASAIFPLKFIFDPRSPFPEENREAYGWRSESGNFKVWKAIERKLCSAAVCTFVVSAEFAQSLRAQTPHGKFRVIPNNYPLTFDMRRSEISSHSTNSSNANSLAYVGSLGHWNDADLYLQFLREFENHIDVPTRATFFVPNQSAQTLRDSISAEQLRLVEANVKSVAQQCVAEELEPFAVGMYLMRTPDTRLGVKFVEYLAAGLPVIVSENVRGAADIVRTHGVGIVLEADLGNMEDIVEFVESVHKNRRQWREKCRAFARHEFSTIAVARKTLSAYESALL